MKLENNNTKQIDSDASFPKKGGRDRETDWKG